jgi:imidazole glycerol-phosphate synthase subunit HisF
MKLRVIAKVVVFNGIAYQTNRFNKAVYLGDPINVCNVLSDQGCQELNLVFVRSAPDFAFVSDVLSICRSPVSVGGVGEKLEDFVQIVASGAEKIIVCDSLWNGSDKPSMLSRRFGRQAVSASVDYIWEDNRRIVVTGDKRQTRLTTLESALKKLPQDLLGEVVLNAISRDGKFCGLDYGALELAREIVQELPILLGGGYGGDTMATIPQGMDGMVVGSCFSLFGKHKAALINYPDHFSVNHVR